MSKIEYAALNYYNNIISDECLCVGVLFHNISTGQRDFRYISNFKRFQAFDDEADIMFVKTYLAGIKQQVEMNIFNYDSDFSIENYKKRYVNEFRFSNVIALDVADDEDYVDNYTKVYLKFDMSKNQRLSRSEEKKYIRKILTSSNMELSDSKVSGAYKENVNFDYVIGKIAIKFFSFKEKDASKLIPSAKQWAFSADELKDKYEVVFLYDDDTDSPQLKIVKQILMEHAKVYKVQKGLEYVLETVS
ncbi:DUF3037 domain-containing protein [Butyrivibrio sp. NC2007]|uniref:DUF3037 domain-containing protein n=1 Tax=Butyrivibrio sp. NC2007 TaxID=1280683 RepID=UPI0003B38302|nr:DUF3037 domain-containing protein [Butyrivibrio sp. NC2007]